MSARAVDQGQRDESAGIRGTTVVVDKECEARAKVQMTSNRADRSLVWRPPITVSPSPLCCFRYFTPARR
jgi:hypothetical protein